MGDGGYVHQILTITERIKRHRHGAHVETVTADPQQVIQQTGDFVEHHTNVLGALRHFDALIGIGTPWPASTSLAAHLLDAHMGRLIIAHRDTSRSNATLQLERYALEGPRAFNYIKMALGMLPFVGSVLALYQAWTAANQATAAFLRGDVADGLAEIESMLLSLIDAQNIKLSKSDLYLEEIHHRVKNSLHLVNTLFNTLPVLLAEAAPPVVLAKV